MDWIKFDDAMFDFVGKLTGEADTAIYGRVTYEMMHNYWPTAGKQPNASKHDIEHSKWYLQSLKVVLSKTISGEGLDNTKVISDDIAKNILQLKQQEGKNIVIFVSPTATHFLFTVC